MNSTVEIRNLSIGYKTKNGFKSLIENLSANLYGGRLTCLLGANGVGKSTLLRTLSGFQPRLAGEIRILGQSIDAYSDKELARTIGVVLTERPNVGDLSVTELIGLGRSPYTGFWGRLNSIDESVVNEVIAWIRIEELADRPVLTLSDGEWQKVMIAKTLAQETPLIYLDEPTAFLDFPSRVEIMHLLLNLSRRRNKTIFLSTHDLELALQIADTLWLMDKKNRMTVGTPDELRLNGSIEDFFRCDGATFDRETGFFKIRPLPQPLPTGEVGNSSSFGGRIHYFNPGHEIALLNASKHYHLPAPIAKMQTDLAFLPAWYAGEGDFVFMETPPPDDFIISCEPLNLRVKPVTPVDFEESSGLRLKPAMSTVDLWGISPQSVYFFEKLNAQRKLSLAIPSWKEELRRLGSRFASQKLLAGLIGRIPEIEPDLLPQFVSTLEAIEQQTLNSRERLLVKSPYSSSGRGLIWLPPAEWTQSEKQALQGMLKKQKQVSIEKALDKQLDFSMQFEITTEGKAQFLGYSIFQTNVKGAYEKSLTDNQARLEKQITSLVNKDVLFQTQGTLAEMIQAMYAPFYTGIIGVDMLVYKTGDSFRLHPCVEVNMRKNMGYLAIRLAEKYLHPEAHGEFTVEFNRDSSTTLQKHRQLQKQYPLIIENGRLRSGYFSLCPVTEATNYQAYVVMF